MKFFKRFSKDIDERELTEMMKIESIGFHLLLWGLVVAIFVQMLVFNLWLPEILPLLILIIITAAWTLVACYKKDYGNQAVIFDQE